MGNYRLFSFWTLWTSAWLLLLQWSGKGTISSQFHFSIKDTTWTTAFISLHLCQSFTLVQIKSQTLLSNTEGKHCTQGIAVNRSCNLSEKLFTRLTAEVLVAAFPQEGGYAGLGTVYSGWTHDSHEREACWWKALAPLLIQRTARHRKSNGNWRSNLEELGLLRVVERQSCSSPFWVILLAMWSLSM